MDDMNWRKSSYSSSNGGQCIEVASPEGAVAVRDTKQASAPCSGSARRRGTRSPTR